MVDGMSDMGTTELGAASTPEQARAAFRDGLVRPTCGIAQGYAQANLMILPKEQAFDFLLFAQRNPKPCPLLEVMEPGVPVRHIMAGRNVPMYDTSIECRSAGAFHSTMVVSMRGIPSTQVADACRISGYHPSVHGAPVCVGDPSAIGIDDIMHPDYGDAPVLEPGDVPVFWACGVTPQAAVMASKPEFAITHAPGHMFITSKRDLEYMV
mgnify:FL=1